MQNIDNCIGEPDVDLIPALLQGNLRIQIKGYALDRKAPLNVAVPLVRAYEEQNALLENSVSHEGVLLANGSRGALSLYIKYIRRKYSGQDGSCAFFTPGYFYYSKQISNFDFDVEKIPYQKGDLPKIGNHVRLLIITNPNNPDGHIYPLEFMQHLLSELDRNPNLHIAQDSIYDQITRDDAPVVYSLFALATPEQRERICVVNSLAKNFAFPAARAGWLITTPEIADKIEKETKDPCIGPMPPECGRRILGATHINRFWPDYADKVNAIYTERLNYVRDRLTQIEGFDNPIPEGGFYYRIKIDFANLSARTIVNTLQARGIILRLDENSDEFIRLNCGVKIDDLETICNGIISVCREFGIPVSDKQIEKPKQDLSFCRSQSWTR